MVYVRMFCYFGGVFCLFVLDNLKLVVIKVYCYVFMLNENYVKMARHYGCAIVFVWFYKLKDKVKVENVVLIVECWILM